MRALLLCFLLLGCADINEARIWEAQRTCANFGGIRDVSSGFRTIFVTCNNGVKIAFPVARGQ